MRLTSIKPTRQAFIFWGLLILIQLQLIPLALAQNQKDQREDFIVALNKQNIEAFLKEVSEITTGQRPDMLHDDVENYFTNHVTNKSTFKSVMKYNIPGFPTQDIDMELDKDQYIKMVLKGLYMLQDYQTEVSIENLKIGSNGKSATFKSRTKEKGRMPWVKDSENKDNSEGNQNAEMIPIEGESVCEQKLIISYNNFMQMAKAECSTAISFDPFAGKPLVP